MDPFTFQLRISDFCLDLLPIDRNLLESNPTLLREAVTEFFSKRFEALGGEARIVATDQEVSVAWTPVSTKDTDALVLQLVELLKAGAYDTAEPFLAALARRCPDNFATHFNYGMMLSNKGELQGAIEHLRKATELSPDEADAWSALGVAYHRRGDTGEARKALEESCRLDPENGHSLRNLGGLIAKSSPEDALKYLRKAALLLPEDQATQYDYGLCLFNAGKYQEADPVLTAAMALAPYTKIAETCRELSTEIAHRSMRSQTDGSIRMDVVCYCMAAMEKIKEVGLERFRPIVVEIVLLGRNGLDINNPVPKYRLKSLPGDFCGMQLVSFMYVGCKRLTPEADPRIDLSREYEMAKEMFEQKEKK